MVGIDLGWGAIGGGCAGQAYRACTAHAIVARAQEEVSSMQSCPFPHWFVRSFSAAFAAVLLGSLSLVAAFPARAHGPTVEVTAASLKPVLLNLYVGTTVHFSSTLGAPEGLVVVDQTGALKSPRLTAPGDGWHYTFDKTGTFEIHVEKHPDAKMRIVVVPKTTP